jgi:hypothetical protein
MMGPIMMTTEFGWALGAIGRIEIERNGRGAAVGRLCCFLRQDLPIVSR